MTLFQTEPPAVEPVDLAEAKAFMRVEAEADDALIERLIGIASRHVEAETGLALVTQSWRLTFDAWPSQRCVRLHRTPVQTVDAVSVYDGDGAPVDVDVSAAVLDGHARPARLYLGTVDAPARPVNGIEIDFTAGYGDAAADVPEPLRQAVLAHVAFMYEVRSAVAPDMQPAGVPSGYERLIAPFRRRAL